MLPAGASEGRAEHGGRAVGEGRQRHAGGLQGALKVEGQGGRL